VSTWDRTNRLERELLEAKRLIETLTAQRDLARSVAMRLEEENAQLASDLVMVPVKGVAT
jgi:hypothetical protein